MGLNLPPQWPAIAEATRRRGAAAGRRGSVPRTKTTGPIPVDGADGEIGDPATAANRGWQAGRRPCRTKEVGDEFHCSAAAVPCAPCSEPFGVPHPPLTAGRAAPSRCPSNRCRGSRMPLPSHPRRYLSGEADDLRSLRLRVRVRSGPPSGGRAGRRVPASWGRGSPPDHSAPHLRAAAFGWTAPSADTSRGRAPLAKPAGPAKPNGEQFRTRARPCSTWATCGGRPIGNGYPITRDGMVRRGCEIPAESYWNCPPVSGLLRHRAVGRPYPSESGPSDPRVLRVRPGIRASRSIGSGGKCGGPVMPTAGFARGRGKS